MSRSNVRSKSSSPPPSDIALNDVPNVTKWFNHKTFFLSRRYVLEGIPPFEVFSFEHSDEQYARVKNQQGCIVKEVYDFGARFWNLTADLIYYVRNVIVVNDAITVTFVRKWMKKDRQEEFTTSFELDTTVPVGLNPIMQDSMPREYCIKLFQKHKDKFGRPMPISHIIKFFNACQYMLVHNNYEMSKKPESERGGITKGRVKRMTDIMLSTWELYPTFARRYSQEIVPIEDQPLLEVPNLENGFGHIVVLIKLNRCVEDYEMFVRPYNDGKRDMSHVEKMLNNGTDPMPSLLKNVPKEEWPIHIAKIKTTELLRW